MKKRLTGYALISVIVTLSLATAFLLTTQVVTQRAVQPLNAASDLSRQTELVPNLLALAPLLAESDVPIPVSRSGPVAIMLPLESLVDLNLANEAMIGAVLGVYRLDTREAVSLLTLRRATRQPFATVEQAMQYLQFDAESARRVARYFTVNGSGSVHLDHVPDSIRGGLEAALQETGRVPITSELGGTSLILTAPNEAAPFTAQVYVTHTGVTGESYQLSDFR